MILRRGSRVIGKIEKGRLIKHIQEHSHLYRAKGWIPALDATIWDKHKVEISDIIIYTDKKRTFTIDAETFEREKETISHGWGRQYVVDKEWWNISSEAQKESRPSVFQMDKKERQGSLFHLQT